MKGLLRALELDGVAGLAGEVVGVAGLEVGLGGAVAVVGGEGAGLGVPDAQGAVGVILPGGSAGA